MAYASPYYDPVKAHEYYMRTRELKGYANRYGGSRGDGTSNASSGYVSDYAKYKSKVSGYGQVQRDNSGHNNQIQNDIKSSKARTASEVSSVKARISRAKEEAKAKQAGWSSQIKQIQDQIRQMSNELKLMTPEQRKANKAQYSEAQKSLRENIKGLRNAITASKDATRDTVDRLNDEIHGINRAGQDEQQRLRQNTKGGSTAGFNQKGKEAAAYIKDSIEKEKKEHISKTNKEIDQKMLNQATAIADRIKRMRDNGEPVPRGKFKVQIDRLLNSARQMKNASSVQARESFQKKYQDEIDKLRQDTSMFTYYDNRELSEQKWRDSVAKRETSKSEARQQRADKAAEAEAKKQENERIKALQKEMRESQKSAKSSASSKSKTSKATSQKKSSTKKKKSVSFQEWLRQRGKTW